MKDLGKAFIIGLLLCGLLPIPESLLPEALAEDDEPDAFKLHELKVHEEKEREHNFKFKGYTSYRGSFAKICALIDSDGQIEWIGNKAQSQARAESDCTPCRTLYLSLASTCKIKKRPLIKVKEKKKKETPTPEPVEQEAASAESSPAESTPEAVQVKKVEKTTIQYDPSTELIDTVLNIFRSMAEKMPREEAESYYTGIAHLIREMRQPEGKTSAEKAYYDTLAEYIEAPFKSRGFVKNQKNSVKSEGFLPIVKEGTDIDELF